MLLLSTTYNHLFFGVSKFALWTGHHYSTYFPFFAFGSFGYMFALLNLAIERCTGHSNVLWNKMNEAAFCLTRTQLMTGYSAPIDRNHHRFVINNDGGLVCREGSAK